MVEGPKYNLRRVSGHQPMSLLLLQLRQSSCRLNAHVRNNFRMVHLPPDISVGDNPHVIELAFSAGMCETRGLLLNDVELPRTHRRRGVLLVTTTWALARLRHATHKSNHTTCKALIDAYHSTPSCVWCRALAKAATPNLPWSASSVRSHQ